MKQRYSLLISLFVGFCFFNINAEEILNKKTLNLHDEMRKLWEDHIQWTRNVIISAIANLADLDSVVTRLLKNQSDIGKAIEPYFGKKNSKRLTKLLKDHILLAIEVVNDAIADNTQQFDQDYAQWKKNARDIANFLHKINPKWSQKDIKEMLYKHLTLTTQEASSRLQQDWQSDIHAYDKNHIHMLMFADMLTKGIIKLFPDKFQ